MNSFNIADLEKKEVGARHEIATKLITEFNMCVSLRSSITTLGVALNQEIELAERQMKGLPITQSDVALQEKTGINIILNWSENKVSSTHSLLREMYGDSSDDPILLTPTPLPELPENIIQRVIKNTKNQILNGELVGVPRDVVLEKIKYEKEKALKEINEQAVQSAKQHQKLISDQLTEGGYYREIMGMWRNLLVYPFACMLAPLPTLEYRNKWQKGKIIPELQLVYKCINIHPNDVYWTPDCTTTQDGTAFFIRRKIGYNDLVNIINYKKSELKGYLKDSIKHILQKASEDSKDGKRIYYTNWSTKGVFSDGNEFTRGTAIDTITRYGKLFGSELRKIGIKDKRINNDELYDTVVTVVAGRVIYATYELEHGKHRRPIHITSWQKTYDGLAGVSLVKKMRDTERAYQAAHRGLLVNFLNSISPSGEIDFQRVEKYLPQIDKEIKDLSVFEAGLMLPVDPNLSGSGTPAIYFHNVPNISTQAMSLMQYYRTIIDDISQIPSILQGSAIQNSAVRTFRQTTQIQGNAMKVLQGAMSNVEQDIIRPIGQMIYEMNVNSSTYSYIQGDCNVQTAYTADLLQKEIKKQQAIETIQVLGQLGQANTIDPQIMQDTAYQLLTALDIDLSKYKDVMAPPQSQPTPDIVPQTSNTAQQ